MSNPTEFLKQLFQSALTAADPAKVLPAYLPQAPKGRTIVLGAGKAAAKMAQVVEQHWNSNIEGIVVTSYGSAVKCKNIEVLEAAHPIPDEAGVTATRKILELAKTAKKDDLIICLISGGGSALLVLPIEGLSLTEKQLVNKQLLASGASISEINCLRKQLSQVKGGRLRLACPYVKMVTLAISDVPGDDPAIIASAPTVVEPSQAKKALEIIKRYNISLPNKVLEKIQSDIEEVRENKILDSLDSEFKLIATPQMALEQAAVTAKKMQINPLILSDRIEGESKDVAKVMAAIALQVRKYNQPIQAPCVLLSGGETTVTIKGKGSGGPNAEFLLAMAVALNGEENIYALACDTDGIDGKEKVAGAFITPETLAKAKKLALNPNTMLANNDAHNFFKFLDNQIITGPTLTNVNDFRAVLIL